MTMGIAAVGAALVSVVEHAGEHLPAEVSWLLVGAMAVVLVSVALPMRTIQFDPEYERIYRIGGSVALLSSAIILLLGFFGLDTVPLLVLLVLLVFAPVFVGFRAWVETLDTEEGPPS
jgi:hypothetical protein